MRLYQIIAIVFCGMVIAGCSQRPSDPAKPDTDSSISAAEDTSAQAATTDLVSGDKTADVPPVADSKPLVNAEHESSPTAPALTEREIEASLFVLEWRLSDARSGDVKFVAIGHGEDGWIDPSATAMERLSGNGLNLLPASKARLPKPGEMESDNRYRGVEDPETGKRSYIYYASVTKWVDENTAEVSYGTYGGPLAGGGGEVVVEKKDGKWSIKERKGMWVS
ncbi:hypothetical protein [Rhodopirellula europaea]|nr:hypothetical protein [Rhodopirellula europaea]